MPLFDGPLAKSKFALNALEFIGLLGGEEVISVLTMIPLYRGRRWLGWYNTPGSLDIARRLVEVGSSFQKHPYRNQSPATLLGLDNHTGPEFVAAFSGTKVQTSHLGYLMLERTTEVNGGRAHQIPGRVTMPVTVTLLEVDPEMIDLERPFPLLHITHTLLALIPITTSIVTCLLCCFVSDWYMFSVILVGMLTSGFASMVIGSGKLTLHASKPPPGAPPGHGMIISGDTGTIVVVRGSGFFMNVITKGKFNLQGDEYWQNGIRLCAVFYLAECVAQVVLIPQGTLFGQIMFIVSLCVSWTHSYRLASFKKERLQAELLFDTLGEPRVRKFSVGTRTTTAVFVCLLLFHGERSLPSAYHRILTAVVPNDTLVWSRWREKVVNQLQSENDESLPYLELDERDQALPDSEQVLLQQLLRDAAAAFKGYLSIYGSLYSPSFKSC